MLKAELFELLELTKEAFDLLPRNADNCATRTRLIIIAAKLETAIKYYDELKAIINTTYGVTGGIKNEN